MPTLTNFSKYIYLHLSQARPALFLFRKDKECRSKRTVDRVIAGGIFH